MATTRYHHPLQIRLGALEIALLSYMLKKTGTPWAQLIRSAIRETATNAPYFEAHDFKRFVVNEFLDTLEDADQHEEFKAITKQFLEDLETDEGFDPNMSIKWE
jgi:hypothetical protein